MKDKLTSRKFWITVAAFLGSIGVSIAGLSNASDLVASIGIICAVVSAAIYAACEAVIDAAGIEAEAQIEEAEIEAGEEIEEEAEEVPG